MSSSAGPKFDSDGVRDHLGNRQPWLSYSFGLIAIVLVAIDLFADHQAWAGVAAIIFIVLGMVTRRGAPRPARAGLIGPRHGASASPKRRRNRLRARLTRRPRAGGSVRLSSGVEVLEASRRGRREPEDEDVHPRGSAHERIRLGIPRAPSSSSTGRRANRRSAGLTAPAHVDVVRVVLGERIGDHRGIDPSPRGSWVPLQDQRRAVLEQRRGAAEDEPLVSFGVHPQQAGLPGLDDSGSNQLVEGHRFNGDRLPPRPARLLLDGSRFGREPVFAGAFGFDDEGRLAELARAATGHTSIAIREVVQEQIRPQHADVVGLRLDRHRRAEPVPANGRDRRGAELGADVHEHPSANGSGPSAPRSRRRNVAGRELGPVTGPRRGTGRCRRPTS